MTTRKSANEMVAGTMRICSFFCQLRVAGRATEEETNLDAGECGAHDGDGNGLGRRVAGRQAVGRGGGGKDRMRSGDYAQIDGETGRGEMMDAVGNRCVDESGWW